jgi:hypothetical protein
MVRKEFLRSLHRKGMTGLSIEQRKSLSKTPPPRVFNTTMPIMHAHWTMFVDGVTILTIDTKQTIQRTAHPSHACEQVATGRGNPGSPDASHDQPLPYMINNLDGVRWSWQFSTSLNPALTLRARMGFASRSNPSHACEQVATGRSNLHPPTLAMINHFPT